jgi:putative pyruvate formate lyase activating enzyme
VGEQGSGAVFFSWCPMHCVYCQNMGLANGEGVEVPDEQLRRIFLRLQDEEHAANLNLVTPTHYLPHIAWTLKAMREAGELRIPVVYNTSGYERAEVLRLLEGLVDIYLVDCKYASAETAQALSKCADYLPVALAGIHEMLRQVGPWREGADGLLEKGVIVRHLVLPGHVGESCQVLDALKASFGDELAKLRLSIMDQFTPLEAAGDLARYGLDGVVSADEYEVVLDHADGLGIEEYFWQEGSTATESFIPAFDLTGV